MGLQKDSLEPLIEKTKDLWGYDWTALLERAERYRKGLIAVAPLKVGDRAELIVTPEITREKAWGWMAYKHFLVAGLKGEIAEVEFFEDGFYFGFLPDNQTYIDHRGEEKPVDKPGMFYFKAADLRKIEPATRWPWSWSK